MAVVVAGVLVLASAVHAARDSGGGAMRAAVASRAAALPSRIGLAIARSRALGVSRRQENRALGELVERSLPLYCGGRRRFAALTFDDGPSAHTKEIQRLLRRAGIPATFFIVGRNGADRPTALRRLERAGAIGNHTWNHTDLTTLRPKRIKQEMSATKALLRTHPAPYAMMRPPYGARNALVTKTLDGSGYAEILWSADSADALGAPWKTVAANTVAGLGPGAVILMHDGPAATLPALRHRIIPAIRRSNLTMVTVPELLALNPPGTARLQRGPKGCKHAGKINVTARRGKLYGERR